MQQEEDQPPIGSVASSPPTHCIFCQLAPALNPAHSVSPDSKERVVFEDAVCYAVHDIRPAARLHLLVITREHVRDTDALQRQPDKYRAIGEPADSDDKQKQLHQPTHALIDLHALFVGAVVCRQSAISAWWASSCSVSMVSPMSRVVSASTWRRSSRWPTCTCTC